ncbi:MAG: SGNH/GDSL hydrolase family protein [Candidatus Omnitrophica bacterium]|nr:SGNH/GDSL hydrolase family protein [Candidatus Omnitrophota bacterium]
MYFERVSQKRLFALARNFIFLSLFLTIFAAASLYAADLQPLPSDPYFAAFKPLQAPETRELLLKEGDRLAICGDSITEQKMYSRIMETYLTVCAPQFKVSVRQFGWSGEQAPGFHHRMENDVLRFKPTVATTCYGMNDHRYQPYNPEYGELYRTTSQAIIREFKENGVRVIQGSPGTVGKMPHWVKQAQGTVNDLNLSLLEFRNIGVQLAREENVAFADVFTPMLVEGYLAQQKYGDDYMISGKDGVHPGWAGHLVMAYAFLKAMGLDGEIGMIVFDMPAGKASASEGHKVLAAAGTEIQLESERYPFCAAGEIDQDSSLRSGMALIPFNQELNRFTLIVKDAPAGRYQVTWGEASKTYSAEELAEGVNLAEDFQVNPFSEAFKRVDDAVAAKQAYETRQIKQLFHGDEGRADMEMTAALTEKTRALFVQDVQAAFKPVRHTIQIEKK